MLTCAGLAADPLAEDPSAGGAHHHAVLPARGELVEAVLGASVRLRGVSHQLTPPIQDLQVVAVGNAQRLLPGDLQAAGGLLAVHLKPRYHGGHWETGQGDTRWVKDGTWGTLGHIYEDLQGDYEWF